MENEERHANIIAMPECVMDKPTSNSVISNISCLVHDTLECHNSVFSLVLPLKESVSRSKSL